MKHSATLLSALFLSSAAAAASAQAPEIMHYTFEGGSVVNSASPGYGGVETVTDVGFAAGVTCSGNGAAGETLSTSTNVATNWTVDLGTSDWSVGMILDLSVGGNGFQYYFGGNSASGFRCFGNGAAGVDNLMLRSPGGDIIVPGATAVGPPTHVVFVYDSSVPELRGYLDGSLVVTQSQSSQLNLVGTAPDFNVMRHTSGMIVGNRMDEFRFYRRAISGAEVMSWAACGGSTLGTNYCMANPNSTGVPSALTAQGSSLVSANDVTLTVSELPANSFAFFLASRVQGFIPNPGGSAGNLCLGGAIGRYVGPGQIQQAGTGGEISLAIDLTQVPDPQAGFIAVAPGETWNFQAWHRDALSGFPTSQFSDGLQIDFQ